MLHLLIALTSALALNIDSPASLLPLPAVDMKTEREVFKYEDSIGGTLSCWKSGHQLAVFSHRTGKVDGYISCYLFDGQKDRKLNTIGYSAMPLKWLMIAGKKYDTDQSESIEFLLSLNLECKDSAEFVYKDRNMPRYGYDQLKLTKDKIVKWMNAKYGHLHSENDVYFGKNMPVLGYSSGLLMSTVRMTKDDCTLVTANMGLETITNPCLKNIIFIFCNGCITGSAPDINR